jgi:phosphopantothenoylcysteine decarboxylase/phosphopantothenate--cysteine ligase
VVTRQLRIVVGITGGIAAYKALSVVRAFVRDGHDVNVVATDAALEFVGRASLEALSRNPISTGLYDDVANVRHVQLGQTADVVVVAPATANTLANMAGGHAHDLLGNILLATRGRVVVAPAMHTEMWNHPATQANVATLRARGVSIVGPEAGNLTGEDSGVGRMVEPDSLVAACYAAAHSPQRLDLVGKRILISGGGTREQIDPVRFLGNRSSGRQAVALAEAALARGATVSFVHAFMDVAVPAGVEAHRTPTAADMLETMVQLSPQHDIVVMAAAVADYRPVEISNEKIKKSADGAPVKLGLVQTADVLATISQSPGRTNLIVGFAAETASGNALEELAREKCERKRCDVIAANTVSWTEGIASHDNAVTLVWRNTPKIERVTGDKLSVAHRILDMLV